MPERWAASRRQDQCVVQSGRTRRVVGYSSPVGTVTDYRASTGTDDTGWGDVCVLLGRRAGRATDLGQEDHDDEATGRVHDLRAGVRMLRRSSSDRPEGGPAPGTSTGGGSTPTGLWLPSLSTPRGRQPRGVASNDAELEAPTWRWMMCRDPCSPRWARRPARACGPAAQNGADGQTGPASRGHRTDTCNSWRSA